MFKAMHLVLFIKQNWKNTRLWGFLFGCGIWKFAIEPLKLEVSPGKLYSVFVFTIFSILLLMGQGMSVTAEWHPNVNLCI